MSGDYRVVLEGAVRVAEVDSADEAVSVAIAKSGDLLNPDLDYVTIEAAERSCPDCGADHPPAFVAAGDALVALEYELTVFNADTEEHASRIARAELGDHLEHVPLSVESVELVEEREEDEPERADEESAGEPARDEEDDNVLPEFEDLVAA